MGEDREGEESREREEGRAAVVVGEGERERERGKRETGRRTTTFGWAAQQGKIITVVCYWLLLGWLENCHTYIRTYIVHTYCLRIVIFLLILPLAPLVCLLAGWVCCCFANSSRSSEKCIYTLSIGESCLSHGG